MVLFVYGNTPSPPGLERMRLLEESGEFEPYMVYWSRQRSTISIPFSSELPKERFIPVALPDPRGNPFRRMLLTLQFAIAVHKVKKRLNPAVLHTSYPDMLVVARLVLFGDRRTALIYEIPDINEQTLSALALGGLRWLLKRSDVVFIHSDRFRSGYLERYNLVRHHQPSVFISVCPEGSLFTGFKRRAADDLVVGYIGNFRGDLQLINLVEAVQAVRDTGRDVRLLLAGAGQDAQLVQALARKYPFIEFHGPFDYYKDILGLYQKIDIIFAVYPQELLNYRVHLARRFSEGILCGIPAIVARGSYMAEISEREQFGWSVRHDSREDLELLLTRVYSSRVELYARGQASESLRQVHSFENYAPKLLEAYRQIIESRSVERL